MLKCLELSNLLKASRIKSVNYRRQTPGSPANLLSPRPLKVNILDATHPSSNASFNSFPSFRSKELGIRAYPMALLDKPDVMWQIQPCPFNTWNDRVEYTKQTNLVAGTVGVLSTSAQRIFNTPRRDRVSMSFLAINAKKRTGGKRHIRVKIVKRLKTAINLIVVRGADATKSNGRPTLVLDENKEDEWILQGWSYIFFPTLEIYRMPYHDLIPKLRSALRFIWERGSAMEKRWAAQISLPGIKDVLLPLVQDSGREKGMNRRPLTEMGVADSRRERSRPLTNHTPRKAPAILNQNEVAVEPQGWRAALDEEANSDNERWEDFNIGTLEDSSTSHEKVLEPPPLLFPPQPQAPSLRQTDAEPWRFSDAPSAMTEAEDAWAKKYPTSVKDTAQRKLFRRQVLTRLPAEPKKSD